MLCSLARREVANIWSVSKEESLKMSKSHVHNVLLEKKGFVYKADM